MTDAEKIAKYDELVAELETVKAQLETKIREEKKAWCGLMRAAFECDAMNNCPGCQYYVPD